MGCTSDYFGFSAAALGVDESGEPILWLSGSYIHIFDDHFFDVISEIHYSYYRWMTSLDFNNAFFVSGCQTMRGMFLLDEFITELDFSGWDTSTVTDMSQMFCFCSSLKDFDFRYLDTASVTNMSDMFSRFGGTDKHPVVRRLLVGGGSLEKRGWY